MDNKKLDKIADCILKKFASTMFDEFNKHDDMTSANKIDVMAYLASQFTATALMTMSQNDHELMELLLEMHIKDTRRAAGI